MILQALNEYYERKPSLPRYGFAIKTIPYILILNPDGTPASFETTYQGSGKNRQAQSFLVPLAVKRSVDIDSNLLWDNPEYVLGVVLKGKKRSAKKTIEEVEKRINEQHEAFKKRIEDICFIQDKGLNAVKLFLQKENKISLVRSLGGPWADLIKEGANLSFKLTGDNCLVAERPAVVAAIKKNVDDIATSSVNNSNLCLVS